MVLSFTDALVQTGQGVLCSVLAVSEDLNRITPRWLRGFPDSLEISRGLRRRLCGTGPADDDDTGVLPPPFTGGQCDGEGYRIQYLDPGDGTPLAGVNASGKTRGPIAGFRTAVEGIEFVGYLTSRAVVGNFTCAQAGPTLGPLQERQWFRVINRGYGGGSFSIVQACGGDACGDPPPILPPVGPVNRTTNITYNIQEGDEITEITNWTIAPIFVDLTGNFRIPFTVDVGGVEFNGEFQLEPNFEINFNIGGGRGPAGETDGDEQPFPEDPSDPIPEIPPDEAQTIIGVEVFSQISPGAEASSILFPTGPNIYAPRLGSVKFAIRTPSSVVWTEDFNIKNRETYIPCPAPQGAVAVRVSPSPGVTVRFNPVRSRPLLPQD